MLPKDPKERLVFVLRSFLRNRPVDVGTLAMVRFFVWAHKKGLDVLRLYMDPNELMAAAPCYLIEMHEENGVALGEKRGQV